MGSGRDRNRRPARRPAFRDPRRRLLIVCEGENTETQYFEQFARFHRNPLVKIEVATEHDKALPAVRIAKRLKANASAAAKLEGDANLKYDAVWCVFDRDEHPLVPEAILMAKNNAIKIAISNPCFELWLILHVRDAPGMLHRHAAQAMLKTFFASYDKTIDYKDYQEGYAGAVERARKLDELAKDSGQPGRNPTTGVYELTESIVPRSPNDSREKPVG